MSTQTNLGGSATTRTTTELSLPGLLLGGMVAVGAVAALAAALILFSGAPAGHGNAYATWAADVPHDLAGRLQWMLSDMTEPQFYAAPLASVGLLAGAALAWWAGRRRKRWAGAPIAYGSGLWGWMLGAALLSLALSNAAFGWQLDQGWQPTFVPFVCVATAVVLVYGAGWRVLLTGAVLGTFTTTPVALLLIAYVTGPLSLPPVVANTAAMSIGTIVSFLVIRALPWMRLPIPAAAAEPSLPSPTTITGTPTVFKDAVWMIRRVAADFTETQFWANELATVGLLAGVLITTLASPGFPAYGSGLLPQILVAQALTSAVGVLVWRRLYRGGGWAPTYISVVSVAPACVLAYGGSPASIVVGAVAGALICPLIARPISARLPADFHPFIGNTISMAVATSLIVPALGLLPFAR